jgi:hypothetical protein
MSTMTIAILEFLEGRKPDFFRHCPWNCHAYSEKPTYGLMTVKSLVLTLPPPHLDHHKKTTRGRENKLPVRWPLELRNTSHY